MLNLGQSALNIMLLIFIIEIWLLLSFLYKNHDKVFFSGGGGGGWRKHMAVNRRPTSSKIEIVFKQCKVEQKMFLMSVVDVDAHNK